MKRTNGLIAILPLLLLVAFMVPCTHGAWWDKGLNLVKSIGGGDTEAAGTADIGAAFKQALQIGSEAVVARLGRTDGFLDDPAVRIPLPEKLAGVKNVLTRVGLSGPVDTLELKLNRAAEAAAPKAEALFLDAIRELTFDDIMTIYKGPKDSATQYFREKMAPSLKEEMQPIVQSSLAQVGAVQAYENVMGKYNALPLVPEVQADLTGHVVERAMDGIFYYMAREEQAIREDPLRQTTALLKKVFGQKQ